MFNILDIKINPPIRRAIIAEIEIAESV